MTTFIQGLSLGLAYVAPIGVQNLFVINAALSQPWGQALRTACIVIFFDVTLALAGFFGIGALIEQWDLARLLILGGGSAALAYMALRLLCQREVSMPLSHTRVPLLQSVSMACVVTWFNPQAIVDVSLLLGSFRAVLAPEDALPFITGVMAASCLWFLAVCALTLRFKKLFSPRVLRCINIVCGVVILCYAIQLGWTLVCTLRF